MSDIRTRVICSVPTREKASHLPGELKIRQQLSVTFNIKKKKIIFGTVLVILSRFLFELFRRCRLRRPLFGRLSVGQWICFFVFHKLKQ